MIAVQQAHTKDQLEAIIALRYKILRQPWAQAFETSRDDLEESSVNAFIESEHAEVIACGRLQENENKIGQIRYMAVAAEFQGKGLGTLILNFLEDKANAIGLETIQLQARENAVPFYEAKGYRIKEKSFLLWGIIQHYLMEKNCR
ncbi:MAG: GNAT family N-acetyltransferase [bacterium]|nr:GNAT family N-acetyltransferase [bacterium]